MSHGWRLALVVLAASQAAAWGEEGRAPPLRVRGISLVALGTAGFDQRGRRKPRQPVRVMPFGGTFQLAMEVEHIEPGRRVRWAAWFGNLVSKGYTETDDAAAYRSKRGPETKPMASIVGFEDRFRGRPVEAVAKPGQRVEPTQGTPGAAYSFHEDAAGHNSARYPLWMRPVSEGQNVLYATVHQRFVYHLMFRLHEGHFARYDLAAQARSVARMLLPYTILLVEDDGTHKRLLAVYSGAVALNAFPIEDLRRGSGVTVEAVRTSPRQVWPEEGTGEP